MFEDKSEDIINIEKILRSLTPKFNFVVCAIEESKNIDELSLDELQSSLLEVEAEVKRRETTTNGTSSTNETISLKEEEKVEDEEAITQHLINESQQTSQMLNVIGATEQEEEISLLMVCHVTEETQPNLWYLDTGCSNHMCGDKGIFSELDETFRNTVKFGNNSTVSVMEKGKITLQIKSDIIHNISNVLFVPDLKTNLLSVGQLQEKGYEIFIKNGVCRIQDEKLGMIAQVNMTSNRMFPLYLQSLTHSCFSAKVKDEAWLWHFRYGHLNFGGLKTLQQKNMVTDLPQIKRHSEICEDCVVGKQHRDSFSKEKSWRAKQVLELIHSDLCESINPTSNGGKRYFVTFIDDYSRKTWVYFLQEKSETFLAFKSFKAKVEREAGMPIKILRSDRGGEYNSQEFEIFCEEHGIKRQRTAAYTPQQNGVSERKNCTIMNMVRSKLKSSGVQKNCWPKAVKWSIHVLNRSPTFFVQNQTPEEAWSGRRPSVEHFRIFGCIAYAHVPDPKRSKLDDKGEKCIFLGVCEQSKAYKLYNPITKKVVISRDVVFNEAEFWSHEKCKPEQRIQVDFEDRDEVTGQQVETNDEAIDIQEISPVGAVERVQRVKRKPTWMQDYVVTGIDQSDEPVVHLALLSDCDPVAFEEAIKKPKWREAMNNEIATIESNNTWELTKLPKGQKAIDVKWVYKTKLNEKGEVDKYKARLVTKGYKQEFGVDYKEVFAPVARHDTIILVIALVARNSWPIFQLDVKSTFLHGDLQEKVFIKQPPGYVKLECENKVYRLKKALYGLKQAPRAWYSPIEAYFLREGFQKCPYEHTLFVKLGEDGKMLIVCLYVDDLIYTGNDVAIFEKFKQSMMLEFDMSDLGKMHYFLGIEVVQSPSGIFISQRKYLLDILMRFRMNECNSVSTPAEFGLKLHKDQGGKKVDNTLRYMENPIEMHLLAAKRIFRYLQGTKEYGLFYKKNVMKSDFVGFTDSDYAGDIDDRKSTSAEFIVATSCACQAIWLKKILEELQFKQEGAAAIYCDNSSAIKLSKHPVLHGRSKHIDVKFHFLKDLTKDGAIDIFYCKSEDQIADIMTKPLKISMFQRFRKLMGVCSFHEPK
ncbi:UNVERIFIED_CONTAM: Retrovirus-related Pol polyprotein from transposon TNT 1-94 [Sesamum latifolium]|uniref:Retrovirus-related Pol polyprotein from transposon TNT 1-94 n=1 Tax=Sesamum latifolium TaxID=2727402 RepID=A0AAW2VV01_9LAMI